MKKIRIVFALIFCFTVAVLFAGCSGNDFSVRGFNNKSDDNKEYRYKIYLITQNKGSNYWHLVDGGCKQAAEELGDIEYKWTAPNNHDIIEQAECLKKAVQDGANAVIISCLSPTELNTELKKAKDKGVKVIYVDSDATEEAVATLQTDSQKAGEIAADSMLKALRAKGITNGVIGITAGNHAANSEARVEGFRKIFEGKGFILSETVYMEGDRQKIRNFVKDNPSYVGFFGSNSQTTFAIGEALKETGSRPVFIAFDTADVTLMMLKDGIVTATMQQNPAKMGYDGLKIAVNALDGNYAEPGTVIDTGVSVIKRE